MESSAMVPLSPLEKEKKDEQLNFNLNNIKVTATQIVLLQRDKDTNLISNGSIIK